MASGSPPKMRPASPVLHRATWSKGKGPNIVAFLHQKGGVGKSILSITTSMLLSQMGFKVALLDTDPQGASSAWGTLHAQRWKVEVSAFGNPLTKQHIAPFFQHDWVLIDSPPGLSAMSVSICCHAHLVITPLRAAWPDVWALSWLGAVIHKQARQGNPCVWRAVFNQANPTQGHEFAAEVERTGAHLHRNALPWCNDWPKIFGGASPPPSAQELLMLLQP